MGYDIFSKNDNSLGQSLNISGWQSLMGLARIFGWQSQGTVMMSWKDNKTGEMFPLVCFDDKKCGAPRRTDRKCGRRLGCSCFLTLPILFFVLGGR